jgi:hypothetical protein
MSLADRFEGELPFTPTSRLPGASTRLLSFA